MPYENSPKLTDYDKVIVKPPKQVSPRLKQVRVLILILAGIVLVLGLVNLAKSDLTASLRGTGTLQGVVLNDHGQPFTGNIFIETTSLKTSTNPDGSFLLKNIPAGKQLVVVADAAAGSEFSVTIISGETTNMGTVLFQSTATP
jgi:hypothetical protein